MGHPEGEKRSLTVSEGTLLKLTAADQNRILNDGAGLSGKVHIWTKSISVHFRYLYRFQGEPREMALDVWPRSPLDTICANFEETKLRVGRGGDPAGQRQAVARKIKVEQAERGCAPAARSRPVSN
ncbi:hypothetical protein B0G62_10733 [Paraburkholderia eburnea]|uniref:Uncharacterized protein n=1 Tax=Paraburkholderia eburnea TaxID=1189126 RepID=A0A2S4M909_9BURK|nr:hypothetical protein [Paraburkholderia eburnea]POR51007.1 hypothetical protein B0G62_10733 [Paraburkholderia eburnea]PRZ21742.1 hypothetical protein BX588_10833 [Paraburkholderia eburnea]